MHVPLHSQCAFNPVPTSLAIAVLRGAGHGSSSRALPAFRVCLHCPDRHRVREFARCVFGTARPVSLGAGAPAPGTVDISIQTVPEPESALLIFLH